MSLTLDEFNALRGEDAEAALKPCLDVARWIHAVADARPYASIEDCLQAGRESAEPLTAEETEAALAHHPRIGERAADRSAEAELSRREQAGLGDLNESVEARLATANHAYEQQFGRVFLIRAAGRTHAEILAELERRLQNDSQRELEETAEQLKQIAVLRLEGLLR